MNYYWMLRKTFLTFFSRSLILVMLRLYNIYWKISQSFIICFSIYEMKCWCTVRSSLSDVSILNNKILLKQHWFWLKLMCAFFMWSWIISSIRSWFTSLSFNLSRWWFWCASTMSTWWEAIYRHYAETVIYLIFHMLTSFWCK